MGFSISGAQVFAAFSWLLAAVWLGKGIAALRGMPRLPDLSRINPESLPENLPHNGPDLTVVVPARDEEVSIEASLRTLLDSTGLHLEIVAVDDRSTDRTGPLMDSLAFEASRCCERHKLEVIHIAELPTGWLGKPHAMAAGARCATAPWILFTDGICEARDRAVEAVREFSREHGLPVERSQMWRDCVSRLAS